MTLRYSAGFLDRLYSTGSIYDLWSELSTIERHHSLPKGSWTFCRLVEWFSASRSGIWTYYEATPLSQQEQLVGELDAFLDLAGIARYYRLGMATWASEKEIQQIDKWIRQQEQTIESALIRLARGERELIENWNGSPRS